MSGFHGWRRSKRNENGLKSREGERSWTTTVTGRRTKLWSTTVEEHRKFKEERIAAGKLIDPKTADLSCGWGQILDPYGLFDLYEEERCTARVYFLRAPGSHILVNSYDLPKATSDEMWRLIKMGFYKDDIDWLF
jgi:hypothetical protein